MIRIKNIDFNASGMRRATSTFLGDLTVTREVPIFAAPMDVRVHSIDFYAKSGHTFNDSQTYTIRARILGASNNTLGSYTVAVSANDRNRITPSSNNSLTAGAVIEFSVSATCQVLSQVLVNVIYSPIKHKATR